MKQKALFLATAFVLALSFLTGCDYSVSGRIVEKNDPAKGISGVTITFSGGFEPVTTDENGYWTKSGLYGAVTITPQKEEWLFEPGKTQVKDATSGSSILFSARLNVEINISLAHARDYNNVPKAGYQGSVRIRRANGAAEEFADAIVTINGINWVRDNTGGFEPPQEMQVDDMSGFSISITHKVLGTLKYHFVVPPSVTTLTTIPNDPKMWVSGQSSNLTMNWDAVNCDAYLPYIHAYGSDLRCSAGSGVVVQGADSNSYTFHSSYLPSMQSPPYIELEVWSLVSRSLPGFEGTSKVEIQSLSSPIISTLPQ